MAKAGGFSARKIVDCVDEEFAFLVEAERINQLRRLGIDLCNLTSGGEGASGFRHSENAKAKMSVKWKPGRIMSKEQRDLIAKRQLGSKASPETKLKMSLAHKGRKHSAESREKMSKARAGVPRLTVITEATRKKLSAARSGENHPMWGKHHTEESKKKISDTKAARAASLRIKKRLDSSNG